MNAVPKIESTLQAIKRIFYAELAQNYQIAGCHRYNAADGTELFRVSRLKHPEREKVIGPIYRDGLRYRKGRGTRPEAGWPLYAPPYPLVASGPVYVVEGEGCADALAKLGLTATTSGGSSTADSTDWSSLRGMSVILWPDNDPAGTNYAAAVTRHLRAHGVAYSIVDVPRLELPEKGDCVDWLAAYPAATADDVRALAMASAEVTVTDTRADGADSTPEPLRRPTPPADPYPIDALGELLAPAAQSIRRVIQAPDAIVGGALLAAASLGAQALADVHIDGRVIPLSLWLLSVAESGERKSAVDSEAMRAGREFERELAKSYADDCAAHENQRTEWEARRDAARQDAKKAKGEGLADRLRDLGPEPPMPLLPRVVAADFTAEGLFKLLAAGRPSIGAFTDEAALVFGGHGMTKETVMRTAGTLCKLWDRGELDRVRSGDGAQKLTGRRFALHLLAQPVIAERALSDDVLAGQGFLARCLLAWPDGTAGSRPYCAESLRDDPAMLRAIDGLLRLHRLPLPLVEGERQSLAPRALRLSPEAFTYWRDFHDTVESECRPGGRFAQVKPWASKSPEQALRIAGVLALVVDPETHAIEEATLDRACELALWHLHEAVRLAGTSALSPEVRNAEALLEWAHGAGRIYVHSSDALRMGPACIRDREAFGSAMNELVDAGWAKPVEGGMHIDGAKRRHVWRIVTARGH